MQRWHSRLFTRDRLPKLAIALAFTGLVSSFYILWFNPFSQPEITDRAQVSGAVATLFALAAGIVAIVVAGWFTSSEFKAEEAVKEDTARLLATLRTMILKHATLTQSDQTRETGLDFELERKVLNDFLCSTSAFGYTIWIGRRSAKAGPGVPEEWRVFFLLINQLLDANTRGHAIRLAMDQELALAAAREPDASEPGHEAASSTAVEQRRSKLHLEDETERTKMVQAAVRLEVLLSSLKRQEVEAIGHYLADLPTAIAGFAASRDLIVQHYEDKLQPGANEADMEFRKFQYLRAMGVDDPDVLLFEAVLRPGPETPETVAQVRKALEDGADPRRTDTEVLARHAAELAEFH